MPRLAFKSIAAAALAWPLLALSGCDPIINIAGAMFPAWLFCAICGLAAAALFRPFFAAFGVEPYMRPLPIAYLSLAIIVASCIWLAFFNRI